MYLKLYDGEDIIAKVVSLDSDYLTITEALQIQRMVQGQQMAVAMLPWVPWTDLLQMSYTLHKDKIVAKVVLAEDTRLAKHYLHMIEGYSTDPTNKFGMMDYNDEDDDDDDDDPEIVFRKKGYLN